MLRAPDGTEIAKAVDAGKVTGNAPVVGAGGRKPEAQLVSMQDSTARKWTEAQHNVLAAI